MMPGGFRQGILSNITSLGRWRPKANQGSARFFCSAAAMIVISSSSVLQSSVGWLRCGGYCWRIIVRAGSRKGVSYCDIGLGKLCVQIAWVISTATITGGRCSCFELVFYQVGQLLELRDGRAGLAKLRAVGQRSQNIII